MHDKLMKMMEKKKDKALDPMYKKSKMQALSELQDAMKGVMGDSLKKVTVASPSREGLEEGLEKAQEVVEKMPGEELGESKETSEESEESKEVASEDSDMDLEKIEEMIKKLEELKRSKMMS